MTSSVSQTGEPLEWESLVRLQPVCLYPVKVNRLDPPMLTKPTLDMCERKKTEAIPAQMLPGLTRSGVDNQETLIKSGLLEQEVISGQGIRTGRCWKGTMQVIPAEGVT